MAIGADTQQQDIEGRRKQTVVLERRGSTIDSLSFHSENLRGRNVDTIEERVAGHAVIAVAVIGRHCAFVAEENPHARPAELLECESLEHRAGRASTAKGERARAAGEGDADLLRNERGRVLGKIIGGNDDLRLHR